MKALKSGSQRFFLREVAKNGEIEIVDQITKVVREFNRSVTDQYLVK